MLKILTFTGYYLPSYKAGGPVKTIENMVENLSDDFEFYIITRDRDIGEHRSFKNVILDEWNQVGNAKVFYLNPENINKDSFNKLFELIQPDVIYLNSFFDPIFTILPLRLNKTWNKKIVLAPRGEFSSAALRLKKWKKKIFLLIGKTIKLYENVVFQASSEFEEDDILKHLSSNVKIVRAIDLPSRGQLDVDLTSLKTNFPKDNDAFKIIFLSRISPMKNLDFILDLFLEIEKKIEFDIYGPIEDSDYWAFCEEKIKKISTNIIITYKGSVSPNDIQATFANYDLFLFPSRGENYGHVIAESLSAGTRVLISDKTPWNNLKEKNLGWDIKLEDKPGFIDVINSFSLNLIVERKKDRSKVVNALKLLLLDPKKVEENRKLFSNLK